MPLSNTQRGFLFLLITLCIWSGFIIISKLSDSTALNAYDVAALRTGSAALVLSPWWLPRLVRGLRKVPVMQALILALMAGIAYPLCAYAGFQLAPAYHGALLLPGVLPAFTMLMALLILGERPTAQRQLGVMLIVTGVVVLFLGKTVAQGDLSHIGDLLFLGGSLSWAVFAVLIRRWNLPAFDVTLAVASYSALLYLPIYIAFLPSNLAQATMLDMATQAIYQGVIVVAVAMWTFAKATEYLGASRVGVFMSLVPIIAMMLSVLILGEALTVAAMIGVVLTVLGAMIGAIRWPSRRTNG